MVVSLCEIEVIFALPEQQWSVLYSGEEGVPLADVVMQSGIIENIPDFSWQKYEAGVWGKVQDPQHYLIQAGDRVEIYRPLLIDPKEARKARADKVRKPVKKLRRNV